MYDVVVIGAGVIGASVARELSRYKLRVCVLEREADIAMGTSKANSAIIHAGFDAKPGSSKARFNVKGNSMFDALSEELDFPFKRNGSLVLCFDESEKPQLEELLMQGVKNGVQGLRILSGDEARRLEPNLSDSVAAALYAPTGGIVCPFELTAGMAENACKNGVAFFLETEVKDIKAAGEGYKIETSRGLFETRMVVNAAGVYADVFNNMVSENKIKIIARKGEYCLFDKAVGDCVKSTVFQLPTKLGKGVLVTPTVDGNLLIGPNAVNIEDKEDTATTRQGLEEILQKAGKSLRQVPYHAVITSFSGLRAGEEKADFIVGEVLDARGFINAAGIESPGLSSAPAIAEAIRDMVTEALHPAVNLDFDPVRRTAPKFREMSNEERQAMIKKDPAYGRIICRCETISEAEIVDAMCRPLGAKTLDGIKRRTRAGAGRCQSGFCLTRVLELMSKEMGVDRTEITKFGRDSRVLVGRNKQEVEG